MSDHLDRLVDRKLTDLGLTRADVGPQAVAAIRTRLALDEQARDPMAAAVDRVLNAQADNGSAERQATRAAEAEQFAKDVAEAWSGHKHLEAPTDREPSNPTPGDAK